MKTQKGKRTEHYLPERKITNKSFTLIEILVVISILGLLAAIMLPVLGSAKKKGTQSVCVSNLKQISLANHQYGIDYDCFCPARSNDGGMGGYPNFWYGNKADRNAPVDYSKGFLARYMGEKEKIIHCPGWKTDNSAARGYGYNAWGVGSIAYLSGYDSTDYTHYKKGMNPAIFKSPGKTVMFADCASYSRGKVKEDKNLFPAFSLKGATLEELKTTKPTTSGSPSRVHARHNKFANIAWVDGHVDAEEITFSWKRGGAEDPNAAENNIGHIGPQDNSWWDPWNN